MRPLKIICGIFLIIANISFWVSGDMLPTLGEKLISLLAIGAGVCLIMEGREGK